MAQHCINSQELLAEAMWPVFSPRKIDVCKMPLLSLKRQKLKLTSFSIKKAMLLNR